MAGSIADNESPMERIQRMEVHPAALLALAFAAVIALLLMAYFAFLRPKMEADRALREFNTPEAQAKRDPDRRKMPPDFQRQIEALRAKEHHVDAGAYRRGRQ
jgi:hypothetical protein